MTNKQLKDLKSCSLQCDKCSINPLRGEVSCFSFVVGEMEKPIVLKEAMEEFD
jgi:hypothetical protein